MPRKENTKAKTWERDRRKRMNVYFKTLADLLPPLQEGRKRNKVDILIHASKYIKDLHSRTEELFFAHATDAHKEELTRLKKLVTQLFSRTQLLSALLKDAGISVPAEPALERISPRKWSNKISAEEGEKCFEKKLKKRREKVTANKVPSKKKPTISSQSTLKISSENGTLGEGGDPAVEDRENLVNTINRDENQSDDITSSSTLGPKILDRHESCPPSANGVKAALDDHKRNKRKGKRNERRKISPRTTQSVANFGAGTVILSNAGKVVPVVAPMGALPGSNLIVNTSPPSANSPIILNSARSHQMIFMQPVAQETNRVQNSVVALQNQAFISTVQKVAVSTTPSIRTNVVLNSQDWFSNVKTIINATKIGGHKGILPKGREVTKTTMTYKVPIPAVHKAKVQKIKDTEGRRDIVQSLKLRSKVTSLRSTKETRGHGLNKKVAVMNSHEDKKSSNELNNSNDNDAEDTSDSDNSSENKKDDQNKNGVLNEKAEGNKDEKKTTITNEDSKGRKNNAKKKKNEDKNKDEVNDQSTSGTDKERSSLKRKLKKKVASHPEKSEGKKRRKNDKNESPENKSGAEITDLPTTCKSIEKMQNVIEKIKDHVNDTLSQNGDLASSEFKVCQVNKVTNLDKVDKEKSEENYKDQNLQNSTETVSKIAPTAVTESQTMEVSQDCESGRDLAVCQLEFETAGGDVNVICSNKSTSIEYSLDRVMTSTRQMSSTVSKDSAASNIERDETINQEGGKLLCDLGSRLDDLLQGNSKTLEIAESPAIATDNSKILLNLDTNTTTTMRTKSDTSTSNIKNNDSEERTIETNRTETCESLKPSVDIETTGSVKLDNLARDADGLKSLSYSTDNSFIPISRTEALHSDLSNDIFASLQVPSSSHNPESISPTAAFLMAFPLVSSLNGKTEVLEEEIKEDFKYHSQTPPMLLQIGTMEPNSFKIKLTDKESELPEGVPSESLEMSSTSTRKKTVLPSPSTSPSSSPTPLPVRTSTTPSSSVTVSSLSSRAVENVTEAVKVSAMSRSPTEVHPTYISSAMPRSSVSGGDQLSTSVTCFTRSVSECTTSDVQSKLSTECSSEKPESINVSSLLDTSKVLPKVVNSETVKKPYRIVHDKDETVPLKTLPGATNTLPCTYPVSSYESDPRTSVSTSLASTSSALENQHLCQVPQLESRTMLKLADSNVVTSSNAVSSSSDVNKYDISGCYSTCQDFTPSYSSFENQPSRYGSSGFTPSLEMSDTARSTLNSHRNLKNFTSLTSSSITSSSSTAIPSTSCNSVGTATSSCTGNVALSNGVGIATSSSSSSLVGLERDYSLRSEELLATSSQNLQQQHYSQPISILSQNVQRNYVEQSRKDVILSTGSQNVQQHVYTTSTQKDELLSSFTRNTHNNYVSRDKDNLNSVSRNVQQNYGLRNKEQQSTNSQNHQSQLQHQHQYQTQPQPQSQHQHSLQHQTQSQPQQLSTFLLRTKENFPQSARQDYAIQKTQETTADEHRQQKHNNYLAKKIEVDNFALNFYVKDSQADGLSNVEIIDAFQGKHGQTSTQSSYLPYEKEGKRFLGDRPVHSLGKSLLTSQNTLPTYYQQTHHSHQPHQPHQPLQSIQSHQSHEAHENHHQTQQSHQPHQPNHLVTTSNYEQSTLTENSIKSTTTVAHNSSNFSILSWTTFSPVSTNNNLVHFEQAQSQVDASATGAAVTALGTSTTTAPTVRTTPAENKSICDNFSYVPLHKDSFGFPSILSDAFSAESTLHSLHMGKSSTRTKPPLLEMPKQPSILETSKLSILSQKHLQNHNHNQSHSQSQNQSQNQTTQSIDYKYLAEPKNKSKYSMETEYIHNEFTIGMDHQHPHHHQNHHNQQQQQQQQHQQQSSKQQSSISTGPKQEKSSPYVMTSYNPSISFDVPDRNNPVKYSADNYIGGSFKYTDKPLLHQTQKYQPLIQTQLSAMPSHNNSIGYIHKQPQNSNKSKTHQQQHQQQQNQHSQHHHHNLHQQHHHQQQQHHQQDQSHQHHQQQQQQQNSNRAPVNWMMTPEVKHNTNITDIILPPIGKELDFCQNNLFSQSTTYNQSTGNQFYNNYDVPHGFPNIPVLQNESKKIDIFYTEEQPFSWSPTKNPHALVEQSQSIKSIEQHIVPPTLPTLVGDLALGTNISDKQNFLFSQIPAAAVAAAAATAAMTTAATTASTSTSTTVSTTSSSLLLTSSSVTFSTSLPTSTSTSTSISTSTSTSTSASRSTAPSTLIFTPTTAVTTTSSLTSTSGSAPTSISTSTSVLILAPTSTLASTSTSTSTLISNTAAATTVGTMATRSATVEHTEKDSISGKDKETSIPISRDFQAIINSQHVCAQGSFLSVSQLVEHEKAEKSQQQQQVRKHQRKSSKRQLDMRKSTSQPTGELQQSRTSAEQQQSQIHQEERKNTSVPASLSEQHNFPTEHTYQQQKYHSQNDFQWRSRNCKSNYTAEALIGSNSSALQQNNLHQQQQQQQQQQQRQDSKHVGPIKFHPNYGPTKFGSGLSGSGTDVATMPLNYFSGVDESNNYGQVNQNFNSYASYSSNASSIYPTTNFITSIQNTPASSSYMMPLHENTDYLESSNSFLLSNATVTPGNSTANVLKNQHYVASVSTAVAAASSSGTSAVIVSGSKNQNCEKRNYSVSKRSKRKNDNSATGMQSIDFSISGMNSPLEDYHSSFLPHGNVYQNSSVLPSPAVSVPSAAPTLAPAIVHPPPPPPSSPPQPSSPAPPPSLPLSVPSSAHQSNVYPKPVLNGNLSGLPMPGNVQNVSPGSLGMSSNITGRGTAVASPMVMTHPSGTSLTNFNLSTIFPEINDKVVGTVPYKPLTQSVNHGPTYTHPPNYTTPLARQALSQLPESATQFVNNMQPPASSVLHYKNA